MPKAAIHCKASVSDGMGHIYRQIHLANELKKQDWEIYFYIPHFAPAIDLLAESGFTPSIINPELSVSEYFDQFFDFVILDIQDTTESLVCSIKKFTHWIVSFEDLGVGRNHVDILIDCNLASSESENLPPHTRGLFDTEYSVLHPDFANYHTQSRHFSNSLQSALITMGATDPQSLTFPLVQLILQERKGIKLTVLVGHNKANLSQLNKLANQFESLNILGPVSNMAQVLLEHEVVFCAGGITLHEAATVGTPAFVINQAEHQQTKARFVEKSGAAINLGLGNSYDVEKIRRALCLGKHELELMSRNGKQLVDGRGLFRVTEAMIKLIKKY